MESINVHLEIREFTAFKFVWLRRFLWIERIILAIVLTIEISIFHGMGCILLLSYVPTDAATPNNFGTCSASLKDTTHKTFFFIFYFFIFLFFYIYFFYVTALLLTCLLLPYIKIPKTSLQQTKGLLKTINKWKEKKRKERKKKGDSSA